MVDVLMVILLPVVFVALGAIAAMTIKNGPPPPGAS